MTSHPAGPAEATPAACSYDLDAALHVVAVDAAWSDFADANGAAHLRAPAVIGQPVLASISDATTALVYRRLFDRVQRTLEPVRFPIRCDSPALRRFLQIEIAPRPGGFRVHSTVVRTESRPPQELLNPARPDDGRLLHMCSWCKRVDVRGRWLEVEDAVRELELFASSVLPRISHTMCESCYADVLRLIPS